MTKKNQQFARYLYRGRAHTLAELERISGLPAQILASRFRLDWSVERAMTTPVKKRKNQGFPGEEQPVQYVDNLARSFLYRRAKP